MLSELEYFNVFVKVFLDTLKFSNKILICIDGLHFEGKKF